MISFEEDHLSPRNSLIVLPIPTLLGAASTALAQFPDMARCTAVLVTFLYSRDSYSSRIKQSGAKNI